jgi:hypothetical protein
MSKLIRDGKVAIIVSPGFGAGWSTWNQEYPDCDTAAELAQCILDGGGSLERETVAKRLFPEAYVGGLDQAEVQWLPEGTHYRIDEYDGAESIETFDETNWRTA